MKTQLVLTVIGEDRPGLVEAVSEVVMAAGANWEASRMAHLGGRFAGMLLVTVDSERAAQLEAALNELPARGMRVIVERAGEGGTGSTGMRRLRLELVGNDREGIIRDISRVLATRGVNVEELRTECDSAPMSGSPLFRLVADLSSPEAVLLDELREVLESLANDLMVDISLHADRRDVD